MHFEFIHRPVVDIIEAFGKDDMVYGPVLLLGEVAVVFLDGIDEQVMIILGELKHKIGLHPVVECPLNHDVEQFSPGHQDRPRRQPLPQQLHRVVYPAQNVPGPVELVLAGEVGLGDGLQNGAQGRQGGHD